ncbi:DUF4396 domain-containing protein [Rhodococcus fascians]|nr:DUF4396 domain-containing protein [Rhodococcus fascians]MBY4237331.1 DUF4396 domain-containing protein [Rhodococcus fascians]MBY4253010.1 DUF4396 domain-containing protein [Rhodococcus fascians]MBY4268750.1 DUF4396 domain-containing protein [Rhodococcus fascians]
MAPSWMNWLAWCTIGLAVLSALTIAWDILVRGYRSQMTVMDVVWPVSALYLGPAAVWAYLRLGRPKTRRWQRRHGHDPAPSSRWSSITLGTSHCGAGCALADVLVPWVVFVTGAALAGRSLYAEFVGAYAAALALGIVFQFWAIAPMRGLGVREGLSAAAKADVISLTAFQVGMFAVMALSSLVVFADAPLDPTEPAYWLVMQLGMIVGFATSWPANALLIDKGVKEAM